MKKVLAVFLLIPVMLFSQESPEEKVYEEVGTEAEFPGGDSAMNKFLIENVMYPEIALENGDQGKVFIEFIVNLDGSLEDLKTVQGASEELNNEAMRVISIMPNWTPAKLDGKKVRAKCRVPINFVMAPSEKESKRKSRKESRKNNR